MQALMFVNPGLFIGSLWSIKTNNLATGGSFSDAYILGMVGINSD